MPKTGSKPGQRHRLAGRTLLAAVLIIAGLIGLLASTSVYLSEPKPPADALNSPAAPLSAKPSRTAIDTYQVAPSLPKYVSIPAIGIAKARVVRLGLTKAGQIAVPSNIYDTGWYSGSAKPGAAGAMFLYGHVSSWTANGIFYNLKDLKPGEKVIITRGDGKQFTYLVDSLKVYPYDQVDMQKVLSPIDTGRPGLNLMTCTGQVIKGTSEFNERLVVFASLLG